MPRGEKTTVVDGPASIGQSESPASKDGIDIDGYVVEEYVSQGGFASVFRGRLVGDAGGREVAVKVMHPERAASTECVLRFQREAKTIRGLAHPNIVEIIELGALADGRPYLVMEWLEGRTLKEELASQGPFSAVDGVEIIGQLAAALRAAHELGVIHRDVKASNVMVVPRGGWFTVKLLDFGIAKLLEDESAEQLTRTGVRVGTPATMAPEQLLCQDVDSRTDVYAAGLLLFQIVTGSLPFKGATWIEYEQLHLHGPRPRASLRAPTPADLDGVILRSLEPKPEDRYNSMEAFAAAAAAAVRGADVIANESIAIHVEVEFVRANPTDEDYDEADLAISLAGEHFYNAEMTVVLELGESLLVKKTLELEPGAQDAGRRSILAAALRATTDLAALELVKATVRVVSSSSADDKSGFRLDDPRTWSVPREVGWLTCPSALASDFGQTVTEEPVDSDGDNVRVTPA